MTTTIGSTSQQPVLQRALFAVKDLSARLEVMERARTEPIAVIGIGCRFPGGAVDPESFWRLLHEGVDAISEVPATRWDRDAFYDSNPDAIGKMCTRQGGFLADVDRFDASFFRIAPREAVRLDPQQRLLLEVAWEAFERAGQTLERLEGSRTGVFVGITNNDYSQLLRRLGPIGVDAYFATGNALNAAAGRLSYVFGLQGPSLALDAACSSSLVAVHLACQSLRSGDSSLALAAGVNLILAPDAHIAMSRAHALAADGRCKTFDARADGYGRGEGCGVLVLKRLSDARADQDPILALLRGSAVRQDGRSGGLTVPNGSAQQAVIRAALEAANVAPGAVSYVEAHGTGTSLGDPIEARALAAVLGRKRSPDRPLFLGAVKTNIGHLESAAGVASLIKVILALQHREIPPHLHLGELNPDIDLAAMGAVIPTSPTAWPDGDGPRIAGVSAFGFSGTIAHAVVEEAPPAAIGPAAGEERPEVLALSAQCPEALRDLARSYGEWLVRSDSPPVADLCYTASVRRTHLDHRLAIAGRTHAELADGLTAFLAGESRPGLSTGVRARPRKLVFVFPGQGGQWPGMARDLLASEPVFGAAIEECERALSPWVDWSLREVLGADPPDARLDRIDVIQPALFALQVGLAALWRSWGVEPDAVVGHSMGEVAAAHVAGALSLEDAARIMARRSQILRRTSGRGAMAVVELPQAEAQRALAGNEDRVAVAASNGPTTTVLSGDPLALAGILAGLQAREVFCRPVKVDVASHSPQMDALRSDLEGALAGLAPREGTVPIYSTVTAAIAGGEQLDAGYWVRNLRQPVLFAQSIEKLLADGHDLFVELAPHPTLAMALQEALLRAHRDGAVLPSLRREEPGRAVLQGSLGALWTLGHPVDFRRQYPKGGHCVPLPSYPWQRERFWVEAGDGPTDWQRLRPASGPAALLGSELRSPAIKGRVFESELSVAALPFLADHRIETEVVVPGACHLARVLCGAREALGPGSCAIEEVSFQHALVLSANEIRLSQLILAPDGSFQLLTRPGAGQDQADWTPHAVGRLRKGSAARGAEPIALDEIRQRCTAEKTGADFYAEMDRAGYHLGPTFQWVDSILYQDGEALGRLRAPRTKDESGEYPLYPGLIDSCFQLIALASRAKGLAELAESDSIYVPVGIKRFLFHACGAPAFCHVVLREDEAAGENELAADVRILDATGAVVADVGFRGKRVRRDVFLGRPQARSDDRFYRVEWQAEQLPAEEKLRPPVPGTWLLLADQGGVSARLATVLQAAGESCVTVAPDELRGALAGNKASCRGIVYLRGLDSAPGEKTTLASLEAAQSLGCDGVLRVLQALAQAGTRDPPRLWIATGGAQPAGDGAAPIAVAQAPLWGLARVIVHEHPELRCGCIDLSASATADEIAALADEIRAGGNESQIALRGTTRFVARLVRHAPTGKRAQEPRSVATEPAGNRPFRLEIDTPGVLENLLLRAFQRAAPGPGEVEIEVRAAGINFVDVLSALGIRPDRTEGPTQLGGECAGVIAALGEGVRDFQVGDEVIAIAAHAFGSYVTVSSGFVARKPVHISFEDAATIPIAFMTAHWAMHHQARLAKGERILIHAASGGVGLAAVQLARMAGAQVFATAGSPEKRDYLRRLGIEHVMDSRSLAFADQVLECTGGEGVDVVLNCLTGEAIPKSLAILAPHGRFLEIGKRDIYQDSQLGLYPFHQNLSYFAVDLIRMFGDRPARCSVLLREVVQLIADRTLAPLPYRAFPISQATDAFRHIAQAKHIGKVVLTLVDPEAQLAPAAREASLFRADASYLITGGLGGLGLTVARWMVEQGARALVLAGRSDPSPEAREAVAALEGAGARVLVERADVARPEQVHDLLARIDARLPPLRGVIHAAGILDDALLLRQTAARFSAVMAPKVAGGWNLHAATLGRALDFFVLFSGAGALLGSPGQGNYAAANAFLDALAHARRRAGLPALSIDWGPWADVGLAARADRGGRLALRGVGSLTPAQGVEALGRLLRDEATQVAVLPLDLRQCFQYYPALAEEPLFSALVREQAGAASPANADAPFRRTLSAAQPGQRRSLLEAHLREQAAKVLGLSPARIDARAPLGSLGFDSLMTLDLRNRLDRSLGLRLSATVVWNYPTIVALAEHLARKMELPLGEPAAEPPAEAVETGKLVALEQLSEDEAEEALAEKLGRLEEVRAP